MGKISNKEKKVISVACAAWGIILIGSGATMTAMAVPETVQMSDLQIIQKRVTDSKSNEIKLKDIEVEINTPLSVDVKDYLENVDNIDSSILKKLKLDISSINITQAGSYKYTITYNKKKYIGTCKIKEKELPKVDLTLKNLKLPIGTAISTDLTTYIVENLSDEVKNNITLDLSKVSTSEAGVYQYTVTYNNNLYTGTIEVYQPQTKVITPNKNEDNNNDKENNNNNTNNNDNNNNNSETTGDNNGENQTPSDNNNNNE